MPPRPALLPADAPGHHRAFLVVFALFVGSIVFSLAGSFLVGFFPAPAAAALGWFDRVLGVSYANLIKGPTWLYMALLPALSLLLYAGELGWRRSVAFLLWGSAIGAAAELIGTTTGFPFGPYSYGEWLGAKIAGHVPYFIPPSWYALSIVSLDLARRLGVGRVGRVLAVGAFMVLWDVALDPAMSHAFPFWQYRVGGVFFGMPLVNWAGWFGTSVVIALGYELLLGGLRPAPDAFVRRWGPRLYAANVLFPVGICFAFGAPLAGVVGLVALGVVFGVLRARQSAAPPARPPVARPVREVPA